jgi:DNA-directed RNA polymerase specialized sigma24 family protein
VTTSRTAGGIPIAGTPFEDVLEELVWRIASGDVVAFRALYDRLAPCVHEAAMCLLDDDAEATLITNATMVEVWRLARRYEAGGDGVHAWALRIAGRRTGDRRRYHEQVGADAPAAAADYDQTLLLELSALLTDGVVHSR